MNAARPDGATDGMFVQKLLLAAFTLLVVALVLATFALAWL